MTNRKAHLSALFVAFLTVGCIAGSLQASPVQGKIRNVHTPQLGSMERKEIVDVMRMKIKELHELDVIFIVKSMNVSRGWAWVHTLPRSKDGRGSYEDFYALLHKVKGRWKIAEIPCTETDNPECLDNPDYFRKLVRRFPGMPSSIFPKETPVR
ncbi:MAG: hypothetical protein HGB36_02990 [Chlorobiaceae bacterium]|jgi:hypothetical protein|nr:hypothetical protein [Chlorobiaceae bacterium]